MANLKDIIYYILSFYPHQSELSNARVTKMIYLADWHCAIKNGKQLSSISWFFNNYGPFVHDVQKEILSNPNLFEVTCTSNLYGEQKTLFSTNPITQYHPQLREEDIIVLKRVINVTKDMSWDQFITFVYSTYPIVNSPRYSCLNLAELASEYRRIN